MRHFSLSQFIFKNTKTDICYSSSFEVLRYIQFHGYSLFAELCWKPKYGGLFGICKVFIFFSSFPPFPLTPHHPRPFLTAPCTVLLP